MRPRNLLTIAACACLASPAPAAAQSLVPVGGTFAAPVHATAPPGDGRRLMVVEQGSATTPGTVKVVRDGVTLEEPFLTIGSDFTGGGERGLLSIAFSPSYESNRLLYTYYTDADGDVRVDEFRRAADSRDRTEAGYRRPVIEIPHREAGNHNGGTASFGPDGHLYLAPGDGGNAYDTPTRDARAPTSLLGKILRIAPTPGGGYTIPAGNPFAGAGDPGADEVWSIGLRNPFRFSFDRTTGDLFVGDVGQGTVEEVNHVPSAPTGTGRGANFGWDDCEGDLLAEPTTGTAPCPLTGDVRPAISLLHQPTGGPCSVIGGLVVRDPSVTQLAGRYLYGDLCLPRLRSYVPGSPGTDREETSLAIALLAGFGEDACGRVHVVSLGGTVSRLEGTPSECALRVPEPGDPGPDPDPAPDPGGGGPPPTAPPRRAAPPAVMFDRLAPALSLGGPRRQRLTARGLLVRARCGEPCSLRALGNLTLRRGGRTIRLRQVLTGLAADRSTPLRMKVSRRSRAAVRRALRRGRRVRAIVRVRVRDANGNLRVARRSIRLRR